MKNRAWICGVAVSILACSAMAGPNEDNHKKHTEVSNQIKKAEGQLDEIRHAIADSDDLAKERQARLDAKQAMMAKFDFEPKVHEARRAIEEARSNLKKVEAAEVDGNPDVVAAQKEVTTTEQVGEDLQAEVRLTSLARDEAKKKVERDPELKKIAPPNMWQRMMSRKDGATTKPNPKELEKNYKDALKAKLAADENYTSLTKKIEGLEAKIKENDAANKAADDKLEKARAKASEGSKKLAEARKAEKDAIVAEAKAVEDVRNERRSVAEATEKAYNAKVDAKFAADPKAKDLRKQLDDVHAQMKTLEDALHHGSARGAPATRPGAATKPTGAAEDFRKRGEEIAEHNKKIADEAADRTQKLVAENAERSRKIAEEHRDRAAKQDDNIRKANEARKNP